VYPSSILLIDAGRTGQSPLGERADGNETAKDGVWVLVALGDGTHERLVTVGGGLDGVVVVPGQHTSLELPNHLGTFADRPHILGGYGAHAGHSRLAGIRVRLAALPVNCNALRLAMLNVSGPNDGAHGCYF